MNEETTTSPTQMWSDFNSDATEKINADLGGTAYAEFDYTNINNILRIVLQDNKVLEIEYDWIYQWRVVDEVKKE